MNKRMLSRRHFLTSTATLAGTAMLAGCSQPAMKESATSSTSETATTTQAATTTAPAKGRTAIAFFSATGNTRAVAQAAATHLGCEFIELQPAQPYTEDDLNYSNGSARATVEQNDTAARPSLANMPDLSGYDTILLGHPIWFGIAPRIMCTLLESYDLAGKRVAEFCTSGSSGIEGATPELERLSPGATWIGTRRFAEGAPASDVAAWLDSLTL